MNTVSRILIRSIATAIAISGCVAAEGQPTPEPSDSPKIISSKSIGPEITPKTTHPNDTTKAVVVTPLAEIAPDTLDIEAGMIFGAKIGMDEPTVRKSLAENHITKIKKVEYPQYFLLQSDDCLGVIFNFRGKLELNDIYTNSREVRLSNGLRLGQRIKKFKARLGQPSRPRKLPSGVGEELTYRVGRFDLIIIRLNENPKIAHALSLTKREQP